MTATQHPTFHSSGSSLSFGERNNVSQKLPSQVKVLANGAGPWRYWYGSKTTVFQWETLSISVKTRRYSTWKKKTIPASQVRSQGRGVEPIRFRARHVRA